MAVFDASFVTRTAFEAAIVQLSAIGRAYSSVTPRRTADAKAKKMS
jgi:hypothetical protein